MDMDTTYDTKEESMIQTGINVAAASFVLITLIVDAAVIGHAVSQLKKSRKNSKQKEHNYADN